MRHRLCLLMIVMVSLPLAGVAGQETPWGDPDLQVIERFRRENADTLMYEFTIDDETTFTRSWTGQIPMVKSDGLIYEYACHEGNYAMTNILKAARAEEARAAGDQ